MEQDLEGRVSDDDGACSATGKLVPGGEVPDGAVPSAGLCHMGGAGKGQAGHRDRAVGDAHDGEDAARGAEIIDVEGDLRFQAPPSLPYPEKKTKTMAPRTTVIPTTSPTPTTG